MQTATHTYVELIERARPDASRARRTDPRGFVRALLARAHERGPLPLGGPWALDDASRRALERDGHGVPPGGWAALAGILADGALLEIRGDALHACVAPDELDAWSDERLARELVGALPERLVPPTSAAGLFLMMGLHPAWGLKLANTIRDEHRSKALEDEGLFPPGAIDAVAHGVFGAIAAILEAIRSLDPETAYPIDGLSRIAWDACEMGRHAIAERNQAHPVDAIPVLFDATGSRLRSMRQRALDFTALDLLDALLVPAGAARRFDDQTFCVFPDHVPGSIDIPTHGALGQTDWLQRLCA